MAFLVFEAVEYSVKTIRKSDPFAQRQQLVARRLPATPSLIAVAAAPKLLTQSTVSGSLTA